MEGSKKPLASLVVCFYNQEEFVAETVKGALSQTYSNLEIVFSDDCSTDGTFQAIKDSVKDYKGSHKVVLNHNEKNLGLVPHVNKVLLELSHGEYIFLNGGDDVSLPQRVEKGVSYFLNNTDVSAVTFSRITINKHGSEIGRENVDKDEILSLEDKRYLKSRSFMSNGVALSFKRNLVEFFGPLSQDCPTEDSTLRFRALLMGKTLKSAEYGLKYRVHDRNMSRTIYKLKTEQIAQQYRRDLEKAKSGLSSELYAVINKKIEYYIKYRNIQAKGTDVCAICRLYFLLKRYTLAVLYKNLYL